MNMRHLLRMARWARRPPSEKRVLLVLAVAAICVVLYALDRWLGLSAWLSLDEVPGGRAWR